MLSVREQEDQKVEKSANLPCVALGAIDAHYIVNGVNR